MRLASFSVTNYRSITSAYKLPFKSGTIIIGPNNEGKSNILRALVTALDVLQLIGGRAIFNGRVRHFFDMGGAYKWESDFPITLQKTKPDGESLFVVEFKLTSQEIEQFKTETNSNLNGTLPIRLALGQRLPGFRVVKKGPGGNALSRKAEKIASFVSRRISVNYIPAVRTADAAQAVVSRMVERRLAALEHDSSYTQALNKIAELQKPVLAALSGSIQATLTEFLPNVHKVSINIAAEERYRAFRRGCEIVVDDGSPTNLTSKGDGVQSLAALSLLRHSVGDGRRGTEQILAIEEPESHLHPRAIHQLKKVINEIAKTNQVIMTTHCPLFVNRSSIAANIVVHHSKAAPAKSIAEIRDILGVHASDNLRNAEIVLLVEGQGDSVAMLSILRSKSKDLARAIDGGMLAIDTLHGASNLGYKLQQVRDALCLPHCFIDNDQAGIAAIKNARLEGYLSEADFNLPVVQSQNESEMEDLYNLDLYKAMLENNYGVVLNKLPKGKDKWSSRIGVVFKQQGKIWDKKTEAKLKIDVCALAAANPATAVNVHLSSPLDALVSSLVEKVNRAVSLDA